MELIPVINFEALNNPSLFSRIISIFQLNKLSHAHRLWKYGAFLVALVYAFNYVTNKLKILILHYHDKSKSFLANTQPLLATFDDELYTSSDEDEDDDDDSESFEEDEDSGNDEEITITNRLLSYDDLSKFDEDIISVKGEKGKFRVPRRRKSIGDDFTLSDLVDGNRIVNLWDGFGLGVEKSFPFLELNKDDWKRFGSFFGSPAVETTGSGSGVSVWDFRCNMSEPVVQGTWRPDRKGKVVAVDLNKTGKICIRDDVTRELTVGDVRKIKTPLTEEEEMWRDADGVSG